MAVGRRGVLFPGALEQRSARYYEEA